jgi:hypothetical protein
MNEEKLKCMYCSHERNWHKQIGNSPVAFCSSYCSCNGKFKLDNFDYVVMVNEERNKDSK